MKTVYIRDSNIFSEKYPDRPNPYFKWEWLREKKDVDVIVFSDAHLVDVESNNSRVKIAWLMEPPVINDFIYKYVRANYKLFDLIFTFDESLLSIDGRFRYCPWGTTWTPPNKRVVHPKSKNISAIFSGKNWTEGHKMRHCIVGNTEGKVDVMGRGYKPLEAKEDGLVDYRFSFAIENMRLDTYFTEKLMDCFTTGTIPIFWGTKKITSIFDSEGMVIVDSLEDVVRVIDTLNETYYNDHRDAVLKNFEIAKDYIDNEKHLWEKGISTLS